MSLVVCPKCGKPLVSTFKFRGWEWFCPTCKTGADMLGGKDVAETAERKRQLKEQMAAFDAAVGAGEYQAHPRWAGPPVKLIPVTTYFNTVRKFRTSGQRFRVLEFDHDTDNFIVQYLPSGLPKAKARQDPPAPEPPQEDERIGEGYLVKDFRRDWEAAVAKDNVVRESALTHLPPYRPDPQPQVDRVRGLTDPTTTGPEQIKAQDAELASRIRALIPKELPEAKDTSAEGFLRLVREVYGRVSDEELLKWFPDYKKPQPALVLLRLANLHMPILDALRPWERVEYYKQLLIALSPPKFTTGRKLGA